MTQPVALTELGTHELAEGPGWYGDQFLYVDMEGQRIHLHNFATAAHKTIDTHGKVGFAVLDTEDRVIAGIGESGIWRLSFASPEKEHLVLPARENPGNIVNDGKCDAKGRLLAGTKNSDDKSPHSGSFAVLHFDCEKGGRMAEICHPVNISNGIAFSPDDKRLYYNDSTDKIWIFDYDIETGQAINRRTFVDLPDDGSVPDGMTIDQVGNLYCAMWGGSRVDVYAPKGDKLEEMKITIPTAYQVSSVAFGKGRDGGDSPDTLYITTAAYRLSKAQKEHFRQSGMILAVKRSIPGFEAVRFNTRRYASMFPAASRSE